MITLKGEATMQVEVGSRYIEGGAIASDSYDGDLTSSIEVDKHGEHRSFWALQRDLRCS